MNGQYKIRRAGDGDTAAAFVLMSALGYEALELKAFEFVFKSVIARENAAVLVAESDRGQIVGLAAMSWRLQLRLAGTLISLDELVVDPAMRGGGVGKALLDEVKALANRVAQPPGRGWRLQLETS